MLEDGSVRPAIEAMNRSDEISQALTRRRSLWLSIAALVAMWVAGCGGGPPPPRPTSSPRCPGSLPSAASAGEILAAAQSAVDCSGGYRVTIHGHNLILPLWGGIDDAIVLVNTQPQARASVRRTGDGAYSLVYVEGQTAFRRDTCDHWARRSGGGGDVLTPFLWHTTRALVSATGPQVVSREPGRVEVSATLRFLGPVLLSVEVATARPVQLIASGPDMDTTWTFDAWGTPPAVTWPPGPLPDQGPGGNPC